MAVARRDERTRAVVTLLGGARVFPKSVLDARGIREALRDGLPYAAFEALVEALDLTAADLARLVGVSSRTLARRKADRQLSPIESDRLYRVAHVALMAAEVLGAPDKARAWLRRPNRALGGEAPVKLLDTEVGSRQVEEVLHRIGFGVLS